MIKHTFNIGDKVCLIDTDETDEDNIGKVVGMDKIGFPVVLWNDPPVSLCYLPTQLILLSNADFQDKIDDRMF